MDLGVILLGECGAGQPVQIAGTNDRVEDTMLRIETVIKGQGLSLGLSLLHGIYSLPVYLRSMLEPRKRLSDDLI